MQTLRIEAASVSSARGFVKALRGFGCELEENDTGYVGVNVPIRTDADILGILEALRNHVAERMNGIPLVGLAGRSYSLGD